MSIKNLIFLTILTLFSYNINAQFINNFKIGAGVTYESPNVGLMSELSVGNEVSEKLTLNFRFARNYQGSTSSFRIGGGIEYRPIKIGRFIPSVGLEYHYNSVDRTFFGFEEKEQFGGFMSQSCSTLKYRIKLRLALAQF